MKNAKLVLLLTALSTVRCEPNRSVRSRIFQKLNSNSSVIMGKPQGRADHPLDCGCRCSRFSSCKMFCYSHTMALCYLSLQQTASDPYVDHDADAECYADCPVVSGYRMYGTRCLKTYRTTKTHWEAEHICELDGGHLYHLKTLHWDSQPLVQLQAAEGDLGPLWLGADDLLTEGRFLWSDNTSVAAHLWNEGQPDDKGGLQDCVQTNQSLRLNDFSCSNRWHFVCQIDV